MYTMSIGRADKLKTLLELWQPETIMTSKQLKLLGITPQHVQKYVASKWVEVVSPGVLRRSKDTVTWQGALHSLQSQIALRVHVGALTALMADGASHYARPGKETVFLFAETGVTLPKWFREYPWPVQISLTQTRVLPSDLCVRPAELGGFDLQASAPERAILEALHLAPNTIDLVEISQVIEGLRTLRPAVMQTLLEACTSFKVKRLFLFLGTRAGLPVMSRLNREAIPLGSGDRTITPGGTYISEFGLIVPRELAS